ncbi:MAG: hypothetical protein KJ892_17335 [Gammaproteobacteria bacterium]|nr:hypothetical protein [Gammaproteobacteria bacterium]
MPRKPVTPTTQSAVLVSSRRRCCICFGLNRDTSLKQGQIAHLDQDSSNPSEENLAFLCFDHHDQYDSKTRQSKNFTIDEVKRYRDELYKAIKMAFVQPVKFGDTEVRLYDPSGDYIRTAVNDSAEIQVRRMENGQFHITGLALWGTQREYGPNLGELDFIAHLSGDTLLYAEPHHSGVYQLSIRFTDSGLIAIDQDHLGFFGFNVNFSGEYAQAT